MTEIAKRPKAATMVARGARLRCPWCGKGGLLESWFRLKPRCPRCGLRTERGEEDFFLGAMMFNLVLSEGVLAVFLVGLVVATWPEVPWTFIQYGGVALMALAPFVFYPVSRTIWLAFDLLLRPLTEEELEWHRTSGEGTFRPQEDR
jgi:uncharacterized protein (DUF983 family)